MVTLRLYAQEGRIIIRYDATIIGSGPAGLEAALNLKIRNKSFVLFGSASLSRKVYVAPRIDNYLGFPGITGKELQQRFLSHLEQMDIPITHQQVQMIYNMGDYFSLATSQDTFESTTVILSPGTASARLLPGEEEFLGRGVGYCATCDAPLYRNKTVAILGYTDGAVHEANYVAELAAKVYYIPQRKTTLTPVDGVEIVTGKVLGIQGDAVVRTLQMEGRDIQTDGVFILRESLAPTALIPGIEISGGFIQVDANMATNLPGCFAAGDCTGMPHQYMRAAGQGQSAALSAVNYLDELADKQERK